MVGRARHRLILFAWCLTFVFSSTAAFAAWDADARDLLQYGPVTLESGDIISFHQGGATLGGYGLTHGHSSMYLGFDSERRQQIFLDFSTTKDGLKEMFLGSPHAFAGRIMSERDFLTYNFRWHRSFDVYRLADRSTLDRRKMFRRAKEIAATTRFGLSGTVCSSAVADVLSVASGRWIGFRTPDGFEGSPFIKHPQQGREPIDIEQVLRDKGRITTPTPPTNRAASDSFLNEVVKEQNEKTAEQIATSESEIRTPDTTEEDSARAERRAAAWQYLKASLRLACSDPDNLRSLNDQRKTWGVLISRSIVEDSFAEDRNLMSSCAQQLMMGVLRSDGPVDLKWVEKQGRRLFKEEQRRVSEERAAAERAARAEEARAEYQEAEHRLSSVSRTSSGSSSPSGSTITDVRGSAYGQAVSIAGGLQTFDGR